MEITWHGNTCFTFKEKGTKVVVNPDKDAGKLKGDIVLSSLGESTAEVEDSYKIFDWPGEYEAREIAIVGFQAWTKAKSKDEEGGAGDATIIFFFEIGGIRVCHLGALGHTLTSDMVNQLGDIDILIIDATKNGNLGSKKATEVMESIDPKVVIPMGEGDLEGNLKELGAESTEAIETYDVKSASALPVDKREYVLLKKS